MAIKYYTVPEKKMTVAIIRDIENDVVDKLKKEARHFPFTIDEKRYLMPKKIRVTVVCDEEDTYNEEAGQKFAKEKLIKSYNRAFNKRVELFEKDLTAFYNDIINKGMSKIRK